MLTGVTTKYPEYNDPRTQTTAVAINFALFAGILGLNMHTEDILRDPNFVQRARSHGLVTFCWGDDNNSTSTIKYLKQVNIKGNFGRFCNVWVILFSSQLYINKFLFCYVAWPSRSSL